jgi:Inositolphosphorylceramide synthase subunit Kei1
MLFASMWFLLVSGADDAASFGDKASNVLNSSGKSADAVVNGIMDESDANDSGATFSTLSITFFWLIKVYFILLVFSYARSLVIRARISPGSFSSHGTFWEKAQNWMLRGDYWKEDEEGYKEVSRMTN